MPSATFKQGSTPDTTDLVLDLAVLLTDGYTGEPRLLGTPSVGIAGLPAPYAKPGESTYLFFGIRPGPYTVQVRPADDSPYYLPADIAVTLPMPNPRWPAFPDISLADLTLPLNDPGQPAAYRAQRALAALVPSVAYPFPSGATTVRGTATSGGLPLPGVLVRNLAGVEQYLTGPDGQFVLALAAAAGLGGTVALLASHPLHPDVNVSTPYTRGAATSVDIDMGP
jgi:hypothetical protein